MKFASLSILNGISGIDLALDADILLHDAQYTVDEYADRQGWGHSSMEDAIQFAGLSRVKQLLLTHHDPMHSDDQLHAIYNTLRETIPSSIPFSMAREGLRVEL